MSPLWAWGSGSGGASGGSNCPAPGWLFPLVAAALIGSSALHRRVEVMAMALVSVLVERSTP